jgi:hypothetical protein
VDISNDNKLDNVYTFSELNISEDFRYILYTRYLTDPYFARVLYLLRFYDLVLEGDFSP